MSNDLASPESPKQDFGSELIHSIAPLRSGLERLLKELGSPRTASALHRLTGGGHTVCWQVYRLVFAENIVAEARHAPTPAALKRLLVEARASGVREETIRSLEQAAAAFQRFIKTHADDRAAFDSMLVGASSDESTDKIVLHHRRAAYRANSHLWGIQSDFTGWTMIVRRSASDEATDDISLMVQRGDRRLRPDARLPLFGYHDNPSESSQSQSSRRPLNPEAAEQYGIPFLPEFCSKPLPKTLKVLIPPHWVLHNVAGNDVGMRRSVDCAYGTIKRDSPLMEDAAGRRLFHSSFLNNRKPSALFVMDVILHRADFAGVKPELMVYQYQGQNLSQEAAVLSQQFPLEERVAHLGRADDVELAEVPFYPEMLRSAAGAAGWDLHDFDVYRVRIPYPILGSMIRVFFYCD